MLRCARHSGVLADLGVVFRDAVLCDDETTDSGEFGLAFGTEVELQRIRSMLSASLIGALRLTFKLADSDLGSG